MIRSGNCLRAAINTAFGIRPALVSEVEMQLRRRSKNLPASGRYWCMADVQYLTNTKVIPFFFKKVRIRHWHEFDKLENGIFLIQALMYKNRRPCIHCFVVNCFTRRVLDNFHKNTFPLNNTWAKKIQLKEIHSCYVLYKFT
jgi:hypothetical protein